MLSGAARERLVVVLVGARNPQNIGAAARAMQDFGFGRLRVVNEYAPAFDTARGEATSAVGADAVMRQARRFDTLPQAIADCGLVVGTTAIGDRNLPQPVLPLREVAEHLKAALDGAVEQGDQKHGSPLEGSGSERQPMNTAILFGSEKTGLTKEQLSHCALLLTIPLFSPEGRHLSMNLGQSVAVCLYELTRDGFDGARALPALQQTLALSEDRERILALLLETMQRSDYARRFPANARIETARQLVIKLGATRDEAATWTGLLRVILRHLPQNEQNAQAPSDAGTPERLT